MAEIAIADRDSTDDEVQISQLMISKTVNLTLELARKKEKGKPPLPLGC
jgi:hypothetical protein